MLSFVEMHEVALRATELEMVNNYLNVLDRSQSNWFLAWHDQFRR